MAILCTLPLVNNFGESTVFTDAYVRVLRTSATKDSCVTTYAILKSAEGRKLEERIVDFPLDLDGPNPIKQAYLHLKTLPEFADAIDC